MSLQGTQMENDDPTTSYMLQVNVIQNFLQHKHIQYIIYLILILIFNRHGQDYASV